MGVMDKAMKKVIGQSAGDLAAVLNEIHGYLEEQIELQTQILLVLGHINNEMKILNKNNKVEDQPLENRT